MTDLKQAILKYVLDNNPVIASTSLNVITVLLHIIEKQAEALELEGKALTMRGMLPMPEHIQKALTETTEALKRLAGQNE